MNYQVRLEKSPETPLAVVRRRATREQLGPVIQEACGLVWNVLRAQHIQGGRHVALYWDCVFNLDIGAEVDAPFAGDGEVVGAKLPAGLTATTTHFGPYQQLPPAHQAVHDWCAANGRRLAGPSWEVYGHWEDAWNDNPSLIRTDVFYLLADGD